MTSVRRARQAAAAAEGRLSPRQRELLAWVQDHMARMGVCPTLAQIRAALGYQRTALQEHMAALETAGLIRRHSVEAMPRGGRVLTPAEMAWCHANPGRVRAMMAIAGDAP